MIICSGFGEWELGADLVPTDVKEATMRVNADAITREDHNESFSVYTYVLRTGLRTPRRKAQSVLSFIKIDLFAIHW